MFYQLVDDVMDARDALSDLQEQKITLPAFYAWQRGTEEEKALIHKNLNHFDPSDLTALQLIFERTNAIQNYC